uniref:Uncharacterized protein n=1 Tax=Aegilops tauschii subsp. strangulata TaxID=200361 RepID=A0A453GEU6_AEGTS
MLTLICFISRGQVHPGWKRNSSPTGVEERRGCDLVVDSSVLCSILSAVKNYFCVEVWCKKFFLLRGSVL